MQQRNIRSIAGYLRSMPDWTEFNTCFEPSKIRISDIDGIVERNGQFLVLDAKQPNTPLPMGQKILYQQLARKGFTVVIVYASTTNDVPSQNLRSGVEAILVDMGQLLVEHLIIFRPNQPQEECDATNQDLWNFIRGWYLQADCR